jgi:organic radical activating enzyme
METEYNYLSATQEKLFPWYRHIQDKQGPITLTIFPTNKCNLKCQFCSNKNRDQTKELSLEYIKETLNQLPSIRTVELSGGGDPTCYPKINELIIYLTKYYNVGLITNGVNIRAISEKSLARLSWLRISINSVIDYNHKIDWKYIIDNSLLYTLSNHIGISYILHNDSNSLYKEKLLELQKEQPFIAYCKICKDSRELSTKDNVIKLTNDGWMYLVERAWGIYDKPCYEHSIKPVLTAEGHLFSCSAVVLKEGHYSSSNSVTLDQIKEYQPIKCNMSCPNIVRNCFIECILHKKDDLSDFV